MHTAAERRAYTGPSLLTYGYRPFFLGSAMFAGLAMPLWLALFAGGFVAGGGAIDPLFWHTHEMIFGYIAGVLAGFLLTAVPNWTGRLPLMGARLAALFALWLCGRVAMALALTGTISPEFAGSIDLAFLAALIAALMREIAAGRNWRNLPVIAIVTLFAMADALMNFGREFALDRTVAERLALAAIAILIALIGGRVTPAFTRNWLRARNSAALPASFGTADRAALAATALGAAAWAVIAQHPVSGILLIVAGACNAWRLSRWRGFATFGEPLVTVLHIGYGWLAAGLTLIGLSILFPDRIPASSGLHALTAGAIGTMTLAIMTRASLGHGGLPLTATRPIGAIYLLVNLGAAIRVAAPFAGRFYLSMLEAGGLLWAAAFVLFSAVFFPILARRRPVAV